MLGTDGQIGRYAIRRRLAYGGMGTLYLAHDPVLDRTVALKLFHADLEGPDARERFVREARAVAALNNPNIVTIYDYGEYSSQPFLVMEHIDGETLAAIIRRKQVLPTIVKVRWMEDLCAAVGYAHERGIIHRDLKPANLMIDAYGRIKVLDFGIARMRDSMVRQTTGLVGTPGYIAPELIRGGRADRRSDVFSIGVVGYELFTWVEPFAANNTLAMSHRILNDDPEPLDTLQPGVPPDLSALVARALVKDPEQRFATAEAMRDGLAAVRRYFESTEPETMSAYSMRVQAESSAPPAGHATSAPTGTGAVPAPAAITPSDPLPKTPAPTPRRTTREALARQRDAQIEGWMELARDHIADGEIADAREACAQVLKIEPAHAGALELLGSIGTDAGRAGRGTDSHRATPPTPPVQHEAPETSAPAASEPAAARPATPAPVARATPAAPAEIPAVVPARAAEQYTAPRVDGTKSRPWSGRVGLALGAAAVLLLTVGVTVWMARRPPAPVEVPLVVVVIDASPWAAVRSVRSESGESQALPPDASTPLALPLPPGSYRVSLVGPPPSSETRDVALHVTPGGQPRVFEPFPSMSADEYLRDIARSRTEAPVVPPGRPQ